RVRAVVDIQHRRLPALEEQRLALVEGAVQLERRVADHGAQAFGVAEQLVDDLVDRNRATVVDLEQQLVLLVERALDLLPQNPLVEEVLNPDADPVDLVGIGGTDSPPGGADLAFAEKALRDLVEGAV